MVRALSGSGPLPTASVLAELADAPQGPASGVNWTGARLLRIQLRDGVLVSMQVVPVGRDAWVRLTGDATQSGDAQILARAFRRLRGNALHVSGTSSATLLGDLRESPPSTNLSTITGIGVKPERASLVKKNM